MKINTTYICEVCGGGYDTEANALACEATPIPPRPPLEVGRVYRHVTEEVWDGELRALDLRKDGLAPEGFGHAWEAVFEDWGEGEGENVITIRQDPDGSWPWYEEIPKEPPKPPHPMFLYMGREQLPQRIRTEDDPC